MARPLALGSDCAPTVGCDGGTRFCRTDRRRGHWPASENLQVKPLARRMIRNWIAGVALHAKPGKLGGGRASAVRMSNDRQWVESGGGKIIREGGHAVAYTGEP